MSGARGTTTCISSHASFVKHQCQMPHTPSCGCPNNVRGRHKAASALNDGDCVIGHRANVGSSQLCDYGMRKFCVAIGRFAKCMTPMRARLCARTFHADASRTVSLIFVTGPSGVASPLTTWRIRKPSGFLKNVKRLYCANGSSPCATAADAEATPTSGTGLPSVGSQVTVGLWL